MEHPGTPDAAEGGPVLALERVGPDMLATVGGKAANLGELARAGLPVPGGFCLTTRAYLDATASTALADVHRDLAATAPDDLARIEAVLPVGWASGDRYSDAQSIGPERYC